MYSAIRSAFIEQFSVFYVLLTERTRNPTPEAMPPGLVQLDKDCTTLAGLLFSRSNVWAARDWRKPPVLKFLLRCLGRNKGGRPLTRLGVAAQAKELSLADPKRWKWSELTAKFCSCGKSEHSISCRDNLRREVLHLGNAIEVLRTPYWTEKNSVRFIPCDKSQRVYRMFPQSPCVINYGTRGFEIWTQNNSHCFRFPNSLRRWASSRAAFVVGFF